MTRKPHPVLTRYYGREEDRASFVVGLFDDGARHYDRLCGAMSFGSGRWYRRRTLERLGLRPGMTVLDAATGTAQVAYAAAGIVRDSRAVVGLDPSFGMLAEAKKRFVGPLVQGRVEDLPFGPTRFDVVTIGYALRHVADLDTAFAECSRVLKPSGTILVLEISRPSRRLPRALLRLYFTAVLPAIMRVTTRSRQASLLSRYYWDTIAECVAPEAIIDSLGRSGFVDVRRRVFGGVLSEYTGRRPPRAAGSADGHLGGDDAAKPMATQNA